MDLNRVDASEQIEVSLAIDLRGVAPGTKQGGTIKQLLHEVTIRCAARDLPDKLEMNINNLQLDETMTLADIILPEGSVLVSDPEDQVVQCVEVDAAQEEESEAGDEAMAEPEVIGRKQEEEESGDE